MEVGGRAEPPLRTGVTRRRRRRFESGLEGCGNGAGEVGVLVKVAGLITA